MTLPFPKLLFELDDSDGLWAASEDGNAVAAPLGVELQGVAPILPHAFLELFEAQLQSAQEPSRDEGFVAKIKRALDAGPKAVTWSTAGPYCVLVCSIVGGRVRRHRVLVALTPEAKSVVHVPGAVEVKDASIEDDSGHVWTAFLFDAEREPALQGPPVLHLHRVGSTWPAWVEPGVASRAVALS